MDEKDFIWIKDPTWVDIIGLDASQRRLEETIGPFHENSYIQHYNTVRSFFKEHQLPQYLGRIIGAPEDQIILDTNDKSTHHDDKSDSDSDDCISLKRLTLILTNPYSNQERNT